jgi:hypothetical protein
MNPYTPPKAKSPTPTVVQAKDTVVVYIVTAVSLEHLRAASSQGQEPMRTEMAKFFDKKDADVFAERLHPSWTRAKVEERSEPIAAQHVAHGGKVGA